MKQILELVGVGASAGGLDALISFFKGVPGNCDSAFLVIQHLSPDHDSMMHELIAPHAKLPVVEAVDGMRLEGGSIYLCPPGVIPRVNQLVLELETRPNNKSVVLSINILFESMGRTVGNSCAAVVLSGTGSDGSKGILTVEESGGIVAAQSPETAEFTGMPQNAISTGKCHIIAPAGQLWRAIKSYADGDGSASNIKKSQSTADEDGSESAQEDYTEIFNHLEVRFGLNFSLYRINSVSRRLIRRMNLLAIPDNKTYLDYLEKNDDEAKSLYHDLLIGVTEFFRDTASFEALRRHAIKSSMTAERSQDFRIWSAGCASGQEAYTLYMLADEVRREVGFTGRITVFATDVFKPSIDVAGKGIYKEEELTGLSPERRASYFQEAAPGYYKIQPHVREDIIFAQHDLLSNAPFINMDIVCCRNVLIYMNLETQEAALSSFTYALRDRGFLFLGGSESLGKLDSSFKVISNKAKIFQKQNNELGPQRWSKKLEQLQKAKEVRGPNMGVSVTINRDLLNAYDSLLDRFAPCGFLINKDREVLHYFGDSADFCIHQSGRARLDLAEQLDKPLRVLITSLMHLAVRKSERVISKGVRCKARSGSCLVDVVIEPFQDLHGEVRNFLIEIQREVVKEPTNESKSVDAATDDHLEALPLNAAEQIKMLEEELKATRENLEAANEELQVSNEELQAVNEELQVSNEEQQSTNEELHSLNEELSTLNSEYERKNKELVEINISHHNLLQSTEDGVLYIDKDMRIRQFNAAIKSAFSISPSDTGRPLRDIAYQMDDAVPLLEDVRSVLETGERIEREATANGHFFMKRINAFRSERGQIDGALLTFTDVTEIKHLQKRFKFALETASISWWDWDLVEDTIEVTSGGTCLLGEGCLDFTHDKEGWMALVHPEDQEQVRKTLDDCLEGRTEEWNCEHRFRTTSGEWLWVSNQGVVKLRDQSGNPLEMMGTTRDVDSYKRALVEAQNQQAILSTTDEVFKVGAWDYNPETEEMIWSEEIYNILEVDADASLSVDATYRLMPPADGKRLREAFERTCLDGTPYDLQLHFKSVNGRELLCRAAGRARFDEKGKIVRVVGIFQDITELTMIEEELKAFFDLSPDFQATLALDGSFKYWSPSWEKNLGYSGEELLSMHVSDLVVEADREGFCKVLNEVAAGSVVTSYETRILRRCKCDTERVAKETWLSWSFSSSLDLSLIFVSARCVTQQKMAQQDLQEARLRAEEANRAKSDFLAVMSHELRTPLNPILGFAELLMEDVQSEEQKDILNTIVQSGSHMLTLIDELLGYSKLDAGKTKVEPVEFSLVDLVQGKVHLMSGQLKGAPIKLNHSIDFGPVDKSRSPILVGDVGMVRQVCRNLISNAIKFTKEGSVDFRVTVEEVKGDRALVRFDVKDTGIGIADEDLSQLFTPFTQVQSGMTREYGGTGLGLAICKRLVELMDGCISVESKEGAGSTFSFTLPLNLRYGEGDATSLKKEAEAQPATPRAKLKGKVLVVEDNESNAFYIKRLIEMQGAAVETAAQGEEALEHLKEQTFDLILLDLHMPGIGGLETLKRVRSSKDKAIPIFILTADASEKAKEDCKKHGADGLLVKPVQPSEIFQVLEKYVEKA